MGEDFEPATHVVAILNWHPTTLNQMKGHWSKGARLKKFDRELVGYSVLGAGVPRAKGPRRVKVEIVLGPRQRAGDVDAYQKSLLDALVACGALVNDSPAWAVVEPVVYSRARAKATVITLSEEYRPRATHKLKGRRAV